MPIYRLGLKSICNEIWVNVLVFEANSFDEATTLVSNNAFDLMVLNIKMINYEKLITFIYGTIKYNKILVLSDEQYEEKSIDSLLSAGVNSLILRSTGREEVMNILKKLVFV